MTKIVAMYLPQFHVIPENSMFWGEGYTDWVAVRKAQALFEGHNEPRIPLNDNYYDLSQLGAIETQVELANKYGIYGFCLYHYWFSTQKNILTKPSEIIYSEKKLSINYCFAWDNGPWVRSWSNVKGNSWSLLDDTDEGENANGVLIPYVFGDRTDWKYHYDYMRKFFFDKRYIKISNKPIFIIWRYSKEMEHMEEYWDKLSKKDGFSGVEFIYQSNYSFMIPSNKKRLFYEPSHSTWKSVDIRIKNEMKDIFIKNRLKKYKYDDAWNRILHNAKHANENVYLGAFVDYDDTPRRGKNGQLMVGASPIKFKKYLSELIDINNKRNAEYVFLTAWNEWGEGAYLEPDEKNKYAYLEALKYVVDLTCDKVAHKRKA